MVRVPARAHLDLLLLASIYREPGDGAAVLREIREQSGQRLALTESTVYPALHRLTRNRLIQRPQGDRRYFLTDAGKRSLAAKQREWRTFVRAVQALLPAED